VVIVRQYPYGVNVALLGAERIADKLQVFLHPSS
jgi:hypothetical protein